MEITGRVINVGSIQSGTSARGEWSKVELVIEFGSEKYPERIAATAMPADKAKGVGIGSKVKIVPNFDANEYSGKWYNRISAWKIELLSQPVQDFNAPFIPGNESPQKVDDSSDGLPF